MIRSLALLTAFCVFAPQLVGADDLPDFKDELPRIPPKTPQESKASIDALEGFTVELVAAEPLIIDPIVVAFDARGRIFAVEMRGYSERPEAEIGRIALLHDDDQDGVMDRRTTFVDGLSWPTAVHPWKDGAVVVEPPTITFYRDVDDDGVSDTKEVWFDGFGRSNVQGMANSLRWTVTGHLHGATSSSEATVNLRPGDEQKMPMRSRDFEIDPLNPSLRLASGGGQHGLSFNRWGNKFVTSNSDHLQQVVDIASWLADHPSRVSVPSRRRSIALDGPQAPVFRTSPVEPWRIVRTRLRVAGKVRGPVEGGGTPAGYFTGATGTWIADAELGYGEPEFDTAIICDVGSNLIHRKSLHPNGLFYEGKRIDAGTEFVRSSDIWFRPTQLSDGPDGSIYVADMYREVIEHPRSLPPSIKKYLDLNSGNDRGRIWRIRRTDATGPVDWRIHEESDAELVARLANPIPWQRRMASQLLVERQSEAALPALREVVANSDVPAARILALHILNRTNGLDEETLRHGIEADHPRVAQHAIELATQRDLQSKVADSTIAAAVRGDAYTMLAALKSMPDLDRSAQERLFARYLAASSDSLLRAIAATAAGDDIWSLLIASLDQAEAASGPAVGSELAAMLSLLLPAVDPDAPPAQHDAMAELLNRLVREDNPHYRYALLDALAGMPGIGRVDALLAQLPTDLTKSIREIVTAAVEEEDVAAWRRARWLRLLPEEEQAIDLAADLLAPYQQPRTQDEALQSLLWNPSEAKVSFALEQWPSLTVSLRRTILQELVRRQEFIPALASALEAQVVQPAEIPTDVKSTLLKTKNKEAAATFDQYFTQTTSDRAKVVSDYATKIASLAGTPDRTAGQKEFERVCAACHKPQQDGQAAGPQLASLTDKSVEQILISVLDPNREIDPRYLAYLVLLDDGRAITGVVAGETGTHLDLIEAGGKKISVLRENIERMESSGVSLMPIGLEEQLTPAQMRDLIDYLRHQPGISQ